MNRIYWKVLVICPFFVANMMAASVTNALPWDGSLTQIVHSIQGPIGFGIGTLALASSVGAHLYRNQLDEIVSHASRVAIGVGGVVAAGSFITAIYGVITGALV